MDIMIQKMDKISPTNTEIRENVIENNEDNDSESIESWYCPW
jgi:hypothetical protein